MFNFFMYNPISRSDWDSSRKTLPTHQYLAAVTLLSPATHQPHLAVTRLFRNKASLAFLKIASITALTTTINIIASVVSQVICDYATPTDSGAQRSGRRLNIELADETGRIKVAAFTSFVNKTDVLLELAK